MNIKSVLYGYGFEPEDKGKYYIVICPECGKKEAFVYKKTSKIECNRKSKCGFVGDVFNVIKSRDKINANFEEYFEEEVIPKESELELPTGISYFAEQKDSIIENTARAYLEGRGISEKNINKLGYIFEPGSFFNKTIFIPFYENGDLVYFVARDWTGKRFIIKDGEKKQLRYINPKGVSSSKFIYNVDSIDENGEVFVFEGLFDALSLEKQVGTATLKAIASYSQIIKILDRNPSKIILIPDNDEAGRKNIYKNLQNFFKLKAPSQNIKFYIYLLEEGKDFNESGKKRIELEKCIEVKNPRFIPELIKIKPSVF